MLVLKLQSISRHATCRNLIASLIISHNTIGSKEMVAAPYQIQNVTLGMLLYMLKIRCVCICFPRDLIKPKVVMGFPLENGCREKLTLRSLTILARVWLL